MSIMDRVEKKQNAVIADAGYQTGKILNAWFLRKNSEKDDVPTIQLTFLAENGGIIKNTYTLVDKQEDGSFEENRNMINILAQVGYYDALDCCLKPVKDDRCDEELSDALNACYGACILLNNLARVDQAKELDFKATQGSFGLMVASSSFKSPGFYKEIAKRRANAEVI